MGASVYLWAAAVSMSLPVGCAVYSGVRWCLDRRALSLAFRAGRERRLRPNTWRQ